MTNMKKLIGAVLGGALALGLVFSVGGCGGGGGGSVSGGAARAAFFITDDLSTAYDHVWVRIHELELEFDGGSVPVFSSSAGVEVDLRALNDGGNLFKYLASASVPERRYTAARVTMGRAVVLFPTGSATGQVASFPTSLDHGTNLTRLTVPVAGGFVVGSGSSVALDFDLSQWTLTGGVVTPVVRRFVGVGLDDPAKMVEDEFSGIVGDLTGTVPTQSFTVTRGSGQVVSVRMDGSTVILNSDGAPSPALAVNQRVEVKGRFNPGTRSVLASVVKIEDPTVDDDFEVEGPTRNANVGSGTFEVKAKRTRGFLPSQLWTSVVTTDLTRFFTEDGLPIGRASFFAALVAGASAEVEGAYDVNTSTLTATKAKLEDFEVDDFPEAKGTAASVNASAGTLGIVLTEWAGFAGAAGQTVNVVTTETTIYRDLNGNGQTKEQWFATLADGQAVKVEGAFAGGTITAKKLERRLGVGTVEAKGKASAGNLSAGTFTLKLASWSGFNGSANQEITVTMQTGATFRDEDGDAITKEQFFAAFDKGLLVEVEGTLIGTQFTAVKGELDD